MNRKLTKKLEMAAGVVEFQRSHPFTDRSQAAIATQFAKKLEEADALARAEHRELLAARAAVREARELRQGLESHLLPSVASIGAFALRGDAQAVSRFTASAANRSRAAFITSAVGVLETAREHRAALSRHGFTKAHVEELGARLQQFTNATAQAKNAQHRHRETRARLTRALSELGELLRLLDAFHRVRLERDPELLRVWTTVRTLGSATATRSRRGAPAVGASPSAPPDPATTTPSSAPPLEATPSAAGAAAPPPTLRPSAAA